MPRAGCEYRLRDLVRGLKFAHGRRETLTMRHQPQLRPRNCESSLRLRVARRAALLRLTPGVSQEIPSSTSPISWPCCHPCPSSPPSQPLAGINGVQPEIPQNPNADDVAAAGAGSGKKRLRDDDGTNGAGSSGRRARPPAPLPSLALGRAAVARQGHERGAGTHGQRRGTTERITKGSRAHHPPPPLCPSLPPRLPLSLSLSPPLSLSSFSLSLFLSFSLSFSLSLPFPSPPPLSLPILPRSRRCG